MTPRCRDRALLDGVAFDANDALATTDAYVRSVASLLVADPGRWTIAAAVAPTTDTTRDRARALRHADAVRTALVRAGVPSARLDAIALTAVDATLPATRVELRRAR